MGIRGRGVDSPGTLFCLFLPPDVPVRVSRQPLQGPWLLRPQGARPHLLLCPDTRTRKGHSQAAGLTHCDQPASPVSPPWGPWEESARV